MFNRIFFGLSVTMLCDFASDILSPLGEIVPFLIRIDLEQVFRESEPLELTSFGVSVSVYCDCSCYPQFPISVSL